MGVSPPEDRAAGLGQAQRHLNIGAHPFCSLGVIWMLYFLTGIVVCIFISRSFQVEERLLRKDWGWEDTGSSLFPPTFPPPLPLTGPPAPPPRPSSG